MITHKIRVVPSQTGTLTIAHDGVVYELFKLSYMTTSKVHVDPVRSLLTLVLDSTNNRLRGASEIFVVVLSDEDHGPNATVLDYIKVTYKDRKDDPILSTAVQDARDLDPDGEEMFAELHFALFAVWDDGKVLTTSDGEHWVAPRVVTP